MGQAQHRDPERTCRHAWCSWMHDALLLGLLRPPLLLPHHPQLSVSLHVRERWRIDLAWQRQKLDRRNVAIASPGKFDGSAFAGQFSFPLILSSINTYLID